MTAGWYKDPAGSSALRWWDGTQWTNHLQQSAPPPPPVAAAVIPPVYAPAQPGGQLPPVQQPAAQEPEIALSAYSPMTGYASQPRDNSRAFDTYASRAPLNSAHVNNTVAWVSFVAGLVSIGAIFIATLLPGTYFLPVFGLTSIIAGIRAIIRYRQRTVTVLWAPIIGMVLGGIAEFILIAGMVAFSNQVAAPPTSQTADIIGPTGTTTRYDMGVGSPQYVPTSNATLSQAALDVSKVVQVLQTDYTDGKVGAAASGSWPGDLVHDASGDVKTIDGRDLGTLISPGWHLAYTLDGTGNMILAISGPDTSELAVYDSVNNEYLAWCESSDATCKTASPVTPQTSQDTSTQAPTTS